jgi:hypothetical protein
MGREWVAIERAGVGGEQYKEGEIGRRWEGTRTIRIRIFYPSRKTDTDPQHCKTLLPDGRILGRWTQKWQSKITCGLENQRPRKRPNSKFPKCNLILIIIGKNWPNNLHTKIFIHFFRCFFFGGGGGGGRLAA